MPFEPTIAPDDPAALLVVAFVVLVVIGVSAAIALYRRLRRRL